MKQAFNSFELVPAAWYVMNESERRIIACNSRLAQISGKTRQNLLGFDWEQAAELMDAAGQPPRRWLETQNEVRERPVHFKTAAGAKATGSYSALRVTLKGHSYLHVFLTLDETEEYLRLKTAIQQSPFIVMITDKEGRIEYVNLQFTLTTGYSPEEALGRSPSLLKSGRVPQTVYKQLWDTILAGQVWEGEIQNRKRNGDLYWQYLRVAPLKNSQGEITHFLGIQHDVTEKHSLLLELAQAQKMETLGALSGGMAHDFNNYLSVIMGYAGLMEMLLEDHPTREQLLEDLKIIQSASQKAAAISRSLLDFSRRQETQLRPLALYRWLLSAKDLLRPLLGPGILLNWELPEPEPWINADPGLLDQALLNLVKNAQQALKGQGTITLRSSPGPETGPWVALSVIDSGPGIAPEVLQRLHEPFFTTKAPGEGTGLGLSMVRRITEVHGGRLEVQSTLGEGTTIQMILPTLPAPVETHVPRGEPAAEVSEPDRLLRPEWPAVLLMTEDIALRPPLLMALELKGFRVSLTVSAAEGLAVFRQILHQKAHVVAVSTGQSTEAERLLQALGQDRQDWCRVLVASKRPVDLPEEVHFLQKPFQPLELALLLKSAAPAWGL